jgi:hypothetical protein
MKVKKVDHNNKKREFTVVLGSTSYRFPYSRCEPMPTSSNRIERLYIDDELAREGFTYFLEDGQEGSVLADHVLDYNCDPDYLRDMLLYQLSVEAQKAIEKSDLTRREIIRRMASSPAQLYRLLDQTNYRKRIDQMVKLLTILDCEVGFVVREKKRKNA